MTSIVVSLFLFFPGVDVTLGIIFKKQEKKTLIGRILLFMNLFFLLSPMNGFCVNAELFLSNQ